MAEIDTSSHPIVRSLTRRLNEHRAALGNGVLEAGLRRVYSANGRFDFNNPVHLVQLTTENGIDPGDERRTPDQIFAARAATQYDELEQAEVLVSTTDAAKKIAAIAKKITHREALHWLSEYPPTGPMVLQLPRSKIPGATSERIAIIGQPQPNFPVRDRRTGEISYRLGAVETILIPTRESPTAADQLAEMAPGSPTPPWLVSDTHFIDLTLREPYRSSGAESSVTVREIATMMRLRAQDPAPHTPGFRILFRDDVELRDPKWTKEKAAAELATAVADLRRFYADEQSVIGQVVRTRIQGRIRQARVAGENPQKPHAEILQAHGLSPATPQLGIAALTRLALDAEVTEIGMAQQYVLPPDVLHRLLETVDETIRHEPFSFAASDFIDPTLSAEENEGRLDREGITSLSPVVMRQGLRARSIAALRWRLLTADDRQLLAITPYSLFSGPTEDSMHRSLVELIQHTQPRVVPPLMYRGPSTVVPIGEPLDELNQHTRAYEQRVAFLQKRFLTEPDRVSELFNGRRIKDPALNLDVALMAALARDMRLRRLTPAIAQEPSGRGKRTRRDDYQRGPVRFLYVCDGGTQRPQTTVRSRSGLVYYSAHTYTRNGKTHGSDGRPYVQEEHVKGPDRGRYCDPETGKFDRATYLTDHPDAEGYLLSKAELLAGKRKPTVKVFGGGKKRS